MRPQCVLSQGGPKHVHVVLPGYYCLEYVKLVYFGRNVVLISFTSLPITTAQHIHDMPEQAGSYYWVIVSPASTAPRRCPGLIDDNINLIPRLLPGLVDSEPQCTTLDFAIMKQKMFAFAQLSKWWPHRIVFSLVLICISVGIYYHSRRLSMNGD